MLAVAFCSPSIDLTDIRKAYNQLNVLHNGVLTMQDLEQASLVERYPAVDFHKIFNSLDLEGSQQVNFLEFTSAVMKVQNQNEKVLRKAFELFNPSEENGGIQKDGLMSTLNGQTHHIYIVLYIDAILYALELMGCDFDEMAVEDMIKSGDLDKDGAISFSDFFLLINVRIHENKLFLTMHGMICSPKWISPKRQSRGGVFYLKVEAQMRRTLMYYPSSNLFFAVSGACH